MPVPKVQLFKTHVRRQLYACAPTNMGAPPANSNKSCFQGTRRRLLRQHWGTNIGFQGNPYVQRLMSTPHIGRHRAGWLGSGRSQTTGRGFRPLAPRPKTCLPDLVMLLGRLRARSPLGGRAVTPALRACMLPPLEARRDSRSAAR